MRNSVPLALGFVLAACGGGGGGVSNLPPPVSAPSPTPAPSPAPTPTPTPPPVNFDTAEYNRSSGAPQHSAISAWQAGATGKGQTIAIVDSGIDLANPEFAGRILSSSRDVTNNNRTVQSIDDHGTNVALVAAAARDNSGILGIAFDASLLVLRADEPGTCGDGSTTGESGCTFFDSAIARGVDAAVAAGARVVNLSLGGNAGITSALRSAVIRASQAGVIVVVASGNGGDGSEPGTDPNQPDSFATSIRAAGGNNVIIVGSVDAANAMSSFSQRAGAEAAYYLAARGEGVCCVYKDGKIFVGQDSSGFYNLVISGTSFAAPQVSGAVALLAQAFPNLTGAQIVRLLLDSADDAGAAGIDPVYGAGILNIRKAMAPRGQLMLPGSTAAVPIDGASLVASVPMGDALAAAGPLRGVGLDSYQRAYTVDLAAGFHGSGLERRLDGALATAPRIASVSAKNMALAVTIAPPRVGQDTAWPSQLMLSGEQAVRAKVLAATLMARLSPDTRMGFAVRESADALSLRMEGARRPAFLIAREARSDRGVLGAIDSSAVIRRELGATGVTLAAESGLVARAEQPLPLGLAPADSRLDRARVDTVSLAVDRAAGAFRFRGSATWQHEDRTFLGARLAPTFGFAGADTLFLDAGASAEIGAWRIGGAWRRGLTVARAGGLVEHGSRLRSEGWSVDLSRFGALVPGDSLGFRLSQPLRVASGGLALLLPASYDYATLQAGLESRRLSLAPRGRELDAEFAWQGPLLGGQGGVSLFWRRDPGHYAGLPDDRGVAIRWSAGF